VPRKSFTNKTCRKKRTRLLKYSKRSGTREVGKKEAVPVSGFVSKCVLDFDICLQSWSNLEHSVGVKEDFLGKSVPFTWDSSRSGINGSVENSARKLTGLHHGKTT